MAEIRGEIGSGLLLLLIAAALLLYSQCLRHDADQPLVNVSEHGADFSQEKRMMSSVYQWLGLGVAIIGFGLIFVLGNKRADQNSENNDCEPQT